VGQDLPLEEYHRAGLEITNGDPALYKELYSRREDVTREAVIPSVEPTVALTGCVSARADRGSKKVTAAPARSAQLRSRRAVTAFIGTKQPNLSVTGIATSKVA
jgi:hypothetical protein